MTSSVIKNPSGERIDLSFHPGTNREALVIFGHGVTGNKDRPLMVALAEGLSARGWPCLRISFAGNGESDGRFEECTITKETADLQAVLGVVPNCVRVAYAGHSMGAAVGVLTAANERRIRALISVAGMARTADFVEREFGDGVPGVGCMWEDETTPLSAGFVADMKSIGEVLQAAASVTQPWLLVHGSEDDVVPVQDGHDAYAAARGEKQWLEIEGAGHSFDETSYLKIIDAMDAWLAVHLGA